VGVYILVYSIVGKNIRINRILRNGKAVIFAFDHGVEHGPSDFPEEHIDPRTIIAKVVSANVDAIMMLPAMAYLTHDLWSGRTSIIVKLTSRTSLRPESERYLQSIFGLFDEAIALGAEAVAATIYWGSQYEDQMLNQWFAIKELADRYGYPILQLSYPRGPEMKNIYDVDVVRYGVRAAVESGADLIKTYYTGSEESFREVVKVAAGVPILMSGGPQRDTLLMFLKDVEAVMRAGGRGVVVGRNVFRHRNPAGVVRAIKAIVHDGLSSEEAIRFVE
jgi:class I fructose-bisphosphate aldolase